MGKIIQHQIFYPNTTQEVWNYLTKPELMVLWLMPNDFEPVLGREFKFTSKPMEEIEFDGIFYCKVLEIIPLKKLSYSWKFGPGNGILHDSVVEWTLSEKENGTELLLVHRGIGNAESTTLFPLMDNGWLQNIQKIIKLLNPATDETTKA